MLKFSHLAILLAFILVIGYQTKETSGEQIQLSVILPKLQAIHEDAQTLLIKNSELKGQILKGLQTQNEKKLKEAKEAQINGAPSVSSQQIVNQVPAPNMDIKQDKNSTIDYVELEEFNKWVDINLDYAVKNTRASIEAFKEEATTASGNVDYSEQAIKDGIEGVKYWQSAVIFQDKTLKNEKIDEE